MRTGGNIFAYNSLPKHRAPSVFWHEICFSVVMDAITPCVPNARLTQRLRSEIVRKSIHFLIAIVPTIAATFGIFSAISLLAGGTLVYIGSEYLRRHGTAVPVITRLTLLASRPRDRDRFVLGPVTLSLGAMVALVFYPEPAASIAIYALAFGDGLAGLVGTFWGSLHIPGTGKSVEGSAACFVATFVAALGFIPSVSAAVIVALVATVLEVLPTHDADNLLLPIGVGLVATLMIV